MRFQMFLPLGALAVLLSACVGKSPPAPPAANPGQPAVATPVKPLFEDREALDLRPYRGRVVVLELGVVGCDLTGEVYEQLRKIHKELGKDAAFVKVDCGQSVKEKEIQEYYLKNPAGFDVFGDPTGNIGLALPSQAMPTLYLFNKWGTNVYFGGYDEASFRKMVGALKAESKPLPENLFFKKVLDRGQPLPEITLNDLAGNKVTLSEYRAGAKAFVVLFCGTSCPTSRLGVEQMGKMANDLGEAGLKVLAVNGEADVEKMRAAYDPMGLSFPVLVDSDGGAMKAYEIDTVPTVFVTGPDGLIALRSLWQEEAITQEVKILLGLMKPEERKDIAQQGGG
jgi:peroxiredoxin